MNGNAISNFQLPKKVIPIYKLLYWKVKFHVSLLNFNKNKNKKNNNKSSVKFLKIIFCS